MRPIPSQNRRSGFTLIELIVVMTIIVVIASLTLGVVSKGFGWVKQKNTEQTMTKVMQRLQNRLMANIQKEVDDWSVNSPVYQQAEFNVTRDKVLKIKYLTKWHFPMTYAEAFHNVQESRVLYGPLGYAPAVAILNKLRRGATFIPDPFSVPFANLLNDAAIPAGPYWPGGTIPAAQVPSQNAACLLAIFETSFGSSGDELTSNEIFVDSSVTSGDTNPRMTDAWGTPLMFLRYGNLSPTCTLGMVGAVNPLTALFADTGTLTLPFNYSATPPNQWNLNLATRTLVIRAHNVFPDMQARLGGAGSLPGKDPDDPEATLVTGRFFTGVDTYYPFPSPAVAGVGWLLSPPCRWLSPSVAGLTNGTYFQSTFGYSLPIGFPNNAARNYSIYAPLVIISAGGDKLWNTWDDNLDSYRLKVNTSGQQ
ncbi:MAG: prepilin-type N-terminal cleavage/methylation domain-containing protein [Planctomycetia bacterium]|nr:prepilin-type N-terminal cleavage/methylation domain-containing protein [Planctomycetia bacterium]